MFFESLWNAFALLPEVEAIALGGSRAIEHYDEKSDYDLYIYCSQVPEQDIRKTILERYCQYMEIGNAFWELEDDCTLKDGVNIDILYRNIKHFSQGLHEVVENHTAYNGYTTCMWHNLLHSRILYDKSGELAELQRLYNVPYPDELRDNIIQRNLRLLYGSLPSYDLQIKKAVSRQDWVSVNHRMAAFLESYFDIIFALNKLTHPGEKRMLQYAKEQAAILPDNFEENLDCLFQNPFVDSENLLKTLAAIVTALGNITEAWISCSRIEEGIGDANSQGNRERLP